jgi:hypothetical protein
LKSGDTGQKQHPRDVGGEARLDHPDASGEQ